MTSPPPLTRARTADTATAMRGSAEYAAQMRYLVEPLDNSPRQTADTTKLGVEGGAVHLGVPYPPLADVPAALDGRAVFQDYMPRALPTLCGCGASWAAAAALALTIRFRVWTGNQVRQQDDKPLVLTMGKVAACNYGSVREYAMLNGAMRGGLNYQAELARLYDTPAVGCAHVETLLGAWQYLYRFGAVDASCASDADFGVCRGGSRDASSGRQGDSPADAPGGCRSVIGDAFGRCTDGAPALLYRAAGFYTLPPDEGAIRQEVYKWGPVPSVVEVTADMDAHAHMRGVYAPPSLTGDRVDLVPRADDAQRRRDRVEQGRRGLAVVILGWGTHAGQPFWLVAAWDRGFMRVARGANAGGIEDNVVAGFPDVPMAAMYMPFVGMDSEIDTFVANIAPVHESGFKDAVIEEELLRGRDVTKDRPDIVSEDMIPDYRSMLAGVPTAVTFPYRGNIWRDHPDVYLFVSAALAVAVLLWGLHVVTRAD